MKQFEAQDHALSMKLDHACREKDEASTASTECSSRLAAKRMEQELCQEKNRATAADFFAAVPETHQFHLPLLNIFMRKLNRSRKRTGNDGNSSEGEDTEDEDDAEDDDDDGSNEYETEFDDSCPSGCEVTLYDQVVELREKRLDQEDCLSEIQRSIEDAQRAHERHVQRNKQISRDVISHSKEIRCFQTEKQQTLNKCANGDSFIQG